MQTLSAWILTAIILTAAYPWSAWLLAQSNRRDGQWLTLLLMLALSTGLLTLVMFWEAMLGVPFNLWAIVLPYLMLMLPGIWLWRRKRPIALNLPIADNISNNPISRRFSGTLLAVIGAAILLNAAYWPFHRDDTLGIYHRYGKLMYETGTLVPFAGRDDAFYQAYPMLIPLSYTYSYVASGWVNEYLAKTISALLSLACVPAVFILGRMLYGSLAGWFGALLLAFTPTFARWASSGYVDLPMAFFYILAAIFAWRLWQQDNRVDALLAGVAIGLAAWTKNAALVGICFLLLWLLYARIKKHIRSFHIVLVMTSAAFVAAPWYIRNWLEARLIIPPTAWTEQAERSLRTLLLLITQPQDFAFTGWIILAAVLAMIASLFRRRTQPADIMLFMWTIPFFAVWWLLVSYDPRFVLLFFPLLCVSGGGWLARIWERTPQEWRNRLVLPLAVVAIAWTLYIVWISVEYKGEILRDPLMSDSAKHAIVLGSAED